MTDDFSLLHYTDKGLYCPQADVFIDAQKPVGTSFITHAHADHARPGHKHYLAHPHTIAVMRHRLGPDINAQALDYHETITINDVRFWLVPAGHAIGSSQIVVENDTERWVITGDCKLDNDTFAEPFEHVHCDVLVVETTFGLPVFSWRPYSTILSGIKTWWSHNQQKNRTSILACYSFGKAQRLLHHFRNDAHHIFVHESIYAINKALQEADVEVPDVRKTLLEHKKEFSRALVLAPDSALGTSWMRRFPKRSIAKASGWMQFRGIRRRGAYDRGFVISDHADWAGLVHIVEKSEAKKVYTTHGYTAIVARYLREEMGIDAEELNAS